MSGGLLYLGVWVPCVRVGLEEGVSQQPLTHRSPEHRLGLQREGRVGGKGGALLMGI